jgi:tetratricopeptide (TPR) repeat protein
VKERRTEKDFMIRPQWRVFILLLAILAVYGKTLQYDFIGLDDTDLIKENYNFIKDLSNLPKAFSTDVFYNPASGAGSNAYYRPLLTVSLMLDTQVGGVSPKFYHFTNLLLHFLSCLLLLKLFIRLKIDPDLSFAGALLFAVHPVLAQAVAWIPGRNDSLLTVFVLAGFIFFLRYLEKKSFLDLTLHLLFSAMALFTKEPAVFLPVLCLLYYFMFSGSSAKRNGILILSSGYAAVILLWYFLRDHVVSQSSADLSPAALFSSFLENLPVFLQTLQKLTVPLNLSLVSVPADTNYIFSVTLVLLVVILAVKSKRADKKRLLFGSFWFCLFLLPTFLSDKTGYEHRAYLPFAGLLLIFFEFDLIKSLDLKEWKNFLLTAGFIILFMIAALLHTDSFSSNYDFWKTAATHSTHSSLARLNYGLALSQNGETDKAFEIYKEGLLLNPSEPRIHNNLGIIYARKGLLQESENEFKEEIKINPRFSEVYFNLGVLYQKEGRDSLKIKAWEKAVELNPLDEVAKKQLEISRIRP